MLNFWKYLRNEKIVILYLNYTWLKYVVWDYLGSDTRKPVSRVSYQVIPEPACSVTETS